MHCKKHLTKHFTKQPQRIISTLVLTSILFLGTGLTVLPSATAAPRNLTKEAQIVKGEPNDRANPLPRAADKLPAPVESAVLQAASGQSGLPLSSLRIVNAEQRTWSDGCLGLGGPDLLCTQALVPGWQVTVEGSKKRLIYRTGESSQVRFDRAATAKSALHRIKPFNGSKSDSTIS